MDLLKNILIGYLRHSLTAACGYLLSRGLIDQSGEQIVIAAVLGLLGVAWSGAQKVVANYELQLAKKAMPPGVLPPPSISPVTKAP